MIKLPIRYRITQILQSGEWLNAKTIAKTVGSTVPTVLSQISQMRNNGYMIDSDGKLNFRTAPNIMLKMLRSPVPMKLTDTD